jgi:NADH-quinone oxidoreductase subunit J
MPIYEIVFYLFSLVMLGAAVMVITVRNPVFAALSLVLTFFSAAAIWMLLEVEFLAIILILVYVGAVLVLFLFVVMMLDINVDAELLLVVWARGRFDATGFPLPAPSPADYSNTKAVGELLFTEYLLPFEVAGVVLLVAIIAAVALTLRQRTGVRRQDPAAQVRVRRDERVRLVKMDPEPRQGR